MTKTKKRIILIAVVVVMIPAIFAGWYFFKMKSEISRMRFVETQEIVKDTLYCIKDSFVTLFIVKDSNSYIVFDAGNDIDIVKEELAKLKIDPAEVKALFLTHTDADHVASIPLFKNAEIYLSKDEVQLINGETGRFMFIGNDLGETAYKTLSDGEAVTFNNVSVKIISTPGHTPGSACYIVNGKYLITGDAAALQDGKLAGFNDFFNMDSDRAAVSIEKLKALKGIEIICSAHYGFFVK